MSRLTPPSLIRGNLGRRPLRTGILAAIVALFCLTLYCGTMVGQKAGAAAAIVSERLGADILFVPYGYEKKVEGSLLRGEPSSFYMDRGLEAKLREEPGVGKVTAQLFLATFKASCCTMPVQIIGYDPETDFVVRPWLRTALDRPVREDEVVVGKKITTKVGEKLMVMGKEFTVAARMDTTGMGFDTSIFLEIDRARRLLMMSELGSQVQLPEGLDRKTFVSSILVKADPGANVTELVNGLSEKYAIDYNLDFVTAAEMITDIGGKLLVFSRFFHIFAAVMWVLAVVVLALVFSASIQERRQEFGVLRTIGASRGQLTGVVFGEALLVGVLGAVIGVVIAVALMWLFNTFIDVTLQLPSATTGLADMVLTGLGVLVPGILVGPLACLPAIGKLGKLDTYLVMRGDA